MEQTEYKYAPAEWATGGVEEMQTAVVCLRAQLLIVAHFARAVDSCPDLGKKQMLHMESAHEEVTNAILDELQAITQKVARIPAQSRREIIAKAKVWLSHEVSKTDDDILALATSICEDLTRLNGSDAECL